jgi:hypothetical protein
VWRRAATIQHSTHQADLKWSEEMRRTAFGFVLVLLSTQCYAQGGPSGGQCDQVRAAIGQHGLQAARKHAAANHGLSPGDLSRIEQSCGIGSRAKQAKR